MSKSMEIAVRNEKKLKEAELILKAVLDDETSRHYLVALTQTYFSMLRGDNE